MSVRLAVRLTPRAGGDQIDGWTKDSAGRPLLKARTSASPADGRANAALQRLIARALDIAPSAVRLTAGAGARIKTLEIDFDDETELRRRLAAPD